MLGNDLIEFRQMKRHQESLLGEAERIRFLAEARRAVSRQRRAQLRVVRRGPQQITSRRRRTSPGRLLRTAAARVGSSLVLVGTYLEGLDGCPLGKG